MFLGIYLKNFKCYQGTQFIPGYAAADEPLIAYLGDNGVGKSAVLEGLQVFFSKKPHWLRNKESKKGSAECFVAPVFLIPEGQLGSPIKKISRELAKNLKIDLLLLPPGHLPVCVVKREDGKFAFYDGKRELDSSESDQTPEYMYALLLQLFRYVYITSEVDIDEQAKINSEIYEIIMGSSISAEIEKLFRDSEEKNNLVKSLNETLKRLIDEKFTKKLKEADHLYSYGSSQGAISQLTINALARVATEAFLDSRKLKYGGKHLEDLSSGQRRTALLDFIITILDGNHFNGKTQLIVAIDEPEISLDSAKKMQQFEKIIKLADSGVQVLFTSHWYGWMVAADIGRSVLIEEKGGTGRVFHQYVNADFPFTDVEKYEMRMFFDFLTSLGASAEISESTRFVICEGVTDRIFLESHITAENYKFIHIGKRHVLKMAKIFSEYYWKSAGPQLKNVLFLVDTDPVNRDDYSNTYARRWSKDDNFKVSLLAGNENFHNRCSIEDTLDPAILLVALKAVFPTESLIQSLSVVYPNVSGPSAFGMDPVKERIFGKELKSKKVLVAEKYKESALALTPRNMNTLLRDLIEKHFTAV